MTERADFWVQRNSSLKAGVMNSSVALAVVPKKTRAPVRPGVQVQGKYPAISGRVVKRLESEMFHTFGRVSEFADIAPSPCITLTVASPLSMWCPLFCRSLSRREHWGDRLPH